MAILIIIVFVFILVALVLTMLAPSVISQRTLNAIILIALLFLLVLHYKGLK